MQKILMLWTVKCDLRSEVVGRSYQDGNAVMEAFNISTMMHPNDLPVGSIRCENTLFPGHSKYPTVLHAIGDGWKLLAPPSEQSETIRDTGGTIEKIIVSYEWWLVKD